MSKQYRIRETLLIAGRKTTIFDEVRRGADVRTQIAHGKTPDGLRPERYMVIIRNGHYADEYEISAADFRQLRAMGVLTAAELATLRAKLVGAIGCWSSCDASKTARADWNGLDL